MKLLCLNLVELKKFLSLVILLSCDGQNVQLSLLSKKYHPVQVMNVKGAQSWLNGNLNFSILLFVIHVNLLHP